MSGDPLRPDRDAADSEITARLAATGIPYPVTDYNGNPLSAGARVEAWYGGVRYTAVVKEFRPRLISDGAIRRIILVREDNRAEVQSFSDAVIALAGLPAEGQKRRRGSGD